MALGGLFHWWGLGFEWVSGCGLGQHFVCLLCVFMSKSGRNLSTVEIKEKVSCTVCDFQKEPEAPTLFKYMGAPTHALTLQGDIWFETVRKGFVSYWEK